MVKINQPFSPATQIVLPERRIEASDYQKRSLRRVGGGSPERRMVSRTRMACSSPSGRVCSGPVHTRPCASSTVPLSRGSPAGRYDSDNAGFRRAASSSTAVPASSIHAPAAATPPRRHLPSRGHATAPGRLGATGETRPTRLPLVVPLGSGLRSREFMATLARVNAAEARRETTTKTTPL